MTGRTQLGADCGVAEPRTAGLSWRVVLSLLLILAAAAVAVVVASPAWAQDQPDDNPPWWQDPLGNVGREISQAINRWFFETLSETLPMVLEAMAGSVLATPEVTANPQVQTAWTSTLVLADALLVLFVVAGGYIVASRDTLQTSYELKEIAPRIVIAGLATHLSLFLVEQIIRFTNALTGAIAADGMAEVVAALEAMIDQQAEANVLMLMLLAVLLVMAIIVIVTFIIRLVVLVALVAAAPLALLCHALPYTEQVAFLWWRALTGVFIIQVGQSLVVVVTVQVFLADPGETFVGFPITGGGWLGVLVGLTMLWLLVKIPMWTREYLWMHSRGVFSKLILAYMMIRTLGKAVAGGQGGTSRAGGIGRGAPRSGPGGPGGGGRNPRQPNPGPRSHHRPSPRSGGRPNPRPNPRPGQGPGPGSGSGPGRGPSGPTPPPGPSQPGPSGPGSPAPPASPPALPGTPPSPSRSDPMPAPGEPSRPGRQPGTPPPRPVPRHPGTRPGRGPQPGPAPWPPRPPDRRPPDRRPPARPTPQRTPVGTTGRPEVHSLRNNSGFGGVRQPVRLARNPAQAVSRPPTGRAPQRPTHAVTGPVAAAGRPRPTPTVPAPAPAGRRPAIPAPARPVGRR